MEQYKLDRISPSDRRGQQMVDELLRKENIRRDTNLDYTVGMFDSDYNLIATGSCFGNTLRCLAVDSGHQGEGLLAKVVTHLMEYEMAQGNRHLFLYTKCDKTAFFADLGFYEIAQVEGAVSFMENRKDGFASFLKELEQYRVTGGTSAALVMNCNPFTLGHKYLVETAAAENDTVHLFVVSEDASLFPFEHRYQMVKDGCAEFSNVVLHKTGSYMISNAVFPSYFLKDEDSVIEVHARLDLTLFAHIAKVLGVTIRYVGEEPYSQVTSIYNNIMLEELPKAGIYCKVIPRRELGELPISASRVRQLIHDGRLEDIREMVPDSTYAYFFTQEGAETVKRIRQAGEVVHY